MSARYGSIASMLSVVLLVGLAPGQQKVKEVEQLRKENAELQKENAALKAALKAAVKAALKAAVKAAPNAAAKQKLKALDTTARETEQERTRKALKNLTEITKKVARGEGVLGRTLRARRAQEGRRRAVELRIRGIKARDEMLARALSAARARQSPSIQDKDFQKALAALNQASRKLGQARNPRKAREVVDEVERILGSARRALWNLEQAAKKRQTRRSIKK